MMKFNVVKDIKDQVKSSSHDFCKRFPLFRRFTPNDFSRKKGFRESYVNRAIEGYWRRGYVTRIPDFDEKNPSYRTNPYAIPRILKERYFS